MLKQNWSRREFFPRLRTHRLIGCLVIAAAAGTATAQATWTIDAKPMVDVVGLATGGVLNFAVPAGAMLLSDGSLVIADRGGPSIQVFDRTGKLVKTVGRAGQGPGEFQSMIWAGACGADSMLVWDLRLRRGSFVDKEGAVARQFTIKSDAGVPRGLFYSCGADGAISYISEPSGRRESTVANLMPMLVHVVALDRDGTIQTDYGQFTGGDWFSPGGRGGFPLPLGATACIAMVGRTIVFGSGDSSSVMVISPNGERRTLVIPSEHRAPTRAEFDAAVQAIAAMAPAAQRQAVIDGLSEAPLPSFLPPYFALFGDPVGLLWVQLSPAGSRDVSLVAMQLNGRVVARVRLPRPLSVYEIGRDYVLGSYSDEADEIHVAAYRLRR